MAEKINTTEDVEDQSEDPVEKLERIQQKILSNLEKNGLLQMIVEKSAHASPDARIEGVTIRAEVAGSRRDHKTKMWIQVYINQEQVSHITPKLYRLTSNEEEQRVLSAQIWAGIQDDDLHFIAQRKIEDLQGRAEKGWLSLSQEQEMKSIAPHVENKTYTFELEPKYAQYRLEPR